jgi:hypothetical protein
LRPPPPPPRVAVPNKKNHPRHPATLNKRGGGGGGGGGGVTHTMHWHERKGTSKRVYQADNHGTLQRNLDLCVPRKGIARPQSQFPYSYTVKKGSRVNRLQPGCH